MIITELHDYSIVASTKLEYDYYDNYASDRLANNFNTYIWVYETNVGFKKFLKIDDLVVGDNTVVIYTENKIDNTVKIGDLISIY
jgi:hypothetical protein